MYDQKDIKKDRNGSGHCIYNSRNVCVYARWGGGAEGECKTLRYFLRNFLPVAGRICVGMPFLYCQTLQNCKKTGGTDRYFAEKVRRT